MLQIKIAQSQIIALPLTRPDGADGLITTRFLIPVPCWCGYRRSFYRAQQPIRSFQFESSARHESRYCSRHFSQFNRMDPPQRATEPRNPAGLPSLLNCYPEPCSRVIVALQSSAWAPPNQLNGFVVTHGACIRAKLCDQAAKGRRTPSIHRIETQPVCGQRLLAASQPALYLYHCRLHLGSRS